MVRVFILVWGMVCFGVSNAQAGAWLREEGKGFLAYSNLTASSLDTTYSAYLDYGYRENLTLGAMIDIDAPIGRPVSGKGYIFARRPLDWGADDANWAYEVGLGARYNGATFVPAAFTSLSYGKGIKWGQRTGWLAVDAGVEWDLGYAQHVVKVDTTLGLTLGERSKGMLQVFTAYGSGWSNVTLAPSYIFQTKKKKINYVVGLQSSSLSPKTVAFKIGVWQSF